MDRRLFLRLAGAAPVAAGGTAIAEPVYKVRSAEKPKSVGFPGLYPGQVSSVRHSSAVDTATEQVRPEAVKRMLREGIQGLTGDKDPRDAWARFVVPEDVVGIKVNCSGAPKMCSRPEVVGEIAASLVSVGVKPENIWVHERFSDQTERVPYKEFLPKRAHVATADQYLGYDPLTFVECCFYGEDDTRSNVVRMVTQHFTKIINVPNMKEHQASGVTGSLKNIAYGEFSNVARSHQYSDTNTRTFIGTLAAVDAVRSRTVLNVMDGLIGVWHGGPFSRNAKYRFYPQQILFGTDPVATDRILLDIIEEKRKAEGAVSIWDRSPEYLAGKRDPLQDPNLNRFVREPSHIEHAAKLGLGEYDRSKIRLREIKL